MTHTLCADADADRMYVYQIRPNATLDHANAPACRAAGQLWAEFYLCFPLAAAKCVFLGTTSPVAARESLHFLFETPLFFNFFIFSQRTLTD